MGEAFDELLLGDDEHQQHRQRGHGRGGHLDVPHEGAGRIVPLNILTNLADR